VGPLGASVPRPATWHGERFIAPPDGCIIQLAWRFLLFQKDSALALWYRQQTADAPSMRKTLIVAVARKLLIALWRLARDGVVPEGVGCVPLPDRGNPQYRFDCCAAPSFLTHVRVGSCVTSNAGPNGDA
jgi:hypothetical protein